MIHFIIAEICFIGLLFSTGLFWYEIVGITRMAITDMRDGSYKPSVLAVIVYLMMVGFVVFATVCSIGAIGLQFHLF